MELKNLEKKSEKSILTNEDLKIAFNLLDEKYPSLLNYSMKQIAAIIAEEFNTECSENDLMRYFDLMEEEDLEKEGRIIEYGN